MCDTLKCSYWRMTALTWERHPWGETRLATCDRPLKGAFIFYYFHYFLIVFVHAHVLMCVSVCTCACMCVCMCATYADVHAHDIWTCSHAMACTWRPEAWRPEATFRNTSALLPPKFPETELWSSVLHSVCSFVCWAHFMHPLWLMIKNSSFCGLELLRSTRWTPVHYRKCSCTLSVWSLTSIRL